MFEVADVPALEKAGFQRIAEDTLGELELAVYFGQGLPGGTDPASATGWAGDDLAIYARGDDTVAIWWTTWDSAEGRDPRPPRSATRVAARTVVVHDAARSSRADCPRPPAPLSAGRA